MPRISPSREGRVALLLWAIACVWTISASWWLGYQTPAGGSIETLGGVPTWILWGVFTPWGTMFVLHILYSLFILGRGRPGGS